MGGTSGTRDTNTACRCRCCCTGKGSNAPSETR
jgi:hypothetical protein